MAAHAIHTLTDLDHTATVVSIDGIGAFDVVSPQVLLDGLFDCGGGAIQRCLSCSISTGLHLRTCGKMKKESGENKVTLPCRLSSLQAVQAQRTSVGLNKCFTPHDILSFFGPLSIDLPQCQERWQLQK